MARILCVSVVVVALGVLSGNPAQGFWWGEIGMQCCDDCSCKQPPQTTLADKFCGTFYTNQQWPSPYVCPDRKYAHAPFNTMIQNGWRRQNLMGSHHFNEDASKLTQAGELKVQWIMTQAPPAYRQMFVERSIDPTVTESRIDTIKAYSEKIATNETPPQVAETHIYSEGRPASTVDFVNNQFRDNQRVPALPTGGMGTAE